MKYRFPWTVIDTDDCLVSGRDSPCENGGVCTDHVKGYTCSCVGSHEGANCEIVGMFINAIYLRQHN